MKTKVLMPLTILLGLALTITAFILFLNGDQGETDIARKPGLRGGSAADTPIPGAASSGDRESFEREILGRKKEETALKRPTMPLELRVLSAEGIVPVTCYHLRVDSPGEESALFEGRVEDALGRFQGKILAADVISLTIEADGFLPRVIEDMEVNSGEGYTGRVILLKREARISGTVLDHETRTPLKGARVISLAAVPRKVRISGEGLDAYGTVTGDDGCFHLPGLPNKVQVVAALRPGYAEGFLRCSPGDAPIEISLRKGYVIHGTITCDDGTPCAGGIAMVRDSLTPITLKATADKNGYYRLPPAVPGSHRVSATGPLGVYDPTFTAQSAVVTIRNQDVKLNFGPSPDDAVLEGRVLFAPGRPVSDGTMSVSRTDPPYLYRSVHTDDRGFFRAPKLIAGTYGIEVDHPSMGGSYSLGTVDLEQPGTTYREFTLPGGMITGRVLRGMQPLEETSSVEVMLVSLDSAENELPLVRFVSLDEESTFRIAALEAGVYQVQVDAGPLGSGKSGPIELKEGQILNGVDVDIPIMGKLCLRVLGLESMLRHAFRNGTPESPAGTDAGSASWVHGKGMHLTLECRTAHPPFEFSTPIPWEDLLGEAGYTLPLQPGSYRVSLDGTDLPVQEAVILPDHVTDLTFRLNLVPEDSEVATLDGLLVFEDGKPMGGAYVRLVTKEGEGRRGRFSTVADPEGRFKITGLWPGTWRMEAYEMDGPAYRLPDLVVPLHPGNSISKTYTVAGGSIQGTIIQAGTGEPIPSNAHWTLYLEPPRQGSKDSPESNPESYYYGMGSEFWIGNIEAGTYTLRIEGPEIGKGEATDLIVPPAGVLSGVVIRMVKDVSGTGG